MSQRLVYIVAFFLAFAVGANAQSNWQPAAATPTAATQVAIVPPLPTTAITVQGAVDQLAARLLLDNDTSQTNEIQQLSLTGGILGISGGGTVDISASGGNVIVATNGLSLTGDEISISGYATASDGTMPTKSGSTLAWANPATQAELDAAIAADADKNVTNELQTISIAGNVISLSQSGGSVTIPAGEATTVANTPTIALALSGAEVTGSVIDASITPAKLDRTYIETIPATQGTDAEIASAIAASEAADADKNATNELQTITRTGRTVTLTQGGGSFTVDTLPSQTGHNTRVLRTNGTTASWSDLPQPPAPFGAYGGVNSDGSNYMLEDGDPNTLSFNFKDQLLWWNWDQNTGGFLAEFNNDPLFGVSIKEEGLNLREKSALLFAGDPGQNDQIMRSKGAGNAPYWTDMPADNDAQQLSISGQSLTISGGNSVNIPLGEATTVANTPTVSMNLSGNQIAANVVDGSITPVKLSQTYALASALTASDAADLDKNATNELDVTLRNAAPAPITTFVTPIIIDTTISDKIYVWNQSKYDEFQKQLGNAAIIAFVNNVTAAAGFLEWDGFRVTLPASTSLRIATTTGTKSIAMLSEQEYPGGSFSTSIGSTGTPITLTTTATIADDGAHVAGERWVNTIYDFSTNSIYRLTAWRHGAVTGNWSAWVEKIGITGATPLTASNGVQIVGNDVRLAPVYGNVYRVATQVIPANAFTDITFTAIGSVLGVTASASANAFTITQAGIYEIDLSTTSDDNGILSGCYITQRIVVNGTAVTGLEEGEDVQTGLRAQLTSKRFVQLAVGDVVKGQVRHSTSNNNTVSMVNMSIKKLN